MNRLGIIAAVLGMQACVLAAAPSHGERIFWAGFSQVKDKPQTAPSTTWHTQPVKEPVTLNFDHLKDPQITPDFKVREKWKDAIPGLSMCRVNPAGEMAIDLDLANDCITMHGDDPKVSGYVGRRFIDRDATRVQATIRRIDATEAGSVYLCASDVVTGAYVMIQWMSNTDQKGSWAITYSNNTAWADWKWWSPAALGVAVDGEVTLAIEIVSPGVFQAYVNDKPIGLKMTMRNLAHITEMRLGCSAAKKGIKLTNLAAWRDEKRVSKKESVYRVSITPLKTKTFTPTNPYGTGIQAAYPEHGFADAMNDPELFQELAKILKDLNTRIIRFPGGCWTYAYSTNGPESMDGLRRLNDAYILDRNQFAWCDARDYFKLCKAIGSDSVYELNLGYWYDPQEKKAYRICNVDATESLESKVRPMEYNLEKLPFALEEAKKIARWAKEIGVKVYWEFGNEDYCYYCPATYVKQSAAFYRAIKEVDPKAEFIVCGDGYSWADWRWPMAVFEEMKKAGMTDIACVSNHVYMFGGTGIPFVDGQHTYDGQIASWANLKYLHGSVRAKLDELGYKNTKPAITEGNVGAPPCPITQEHNMGRSLGEAEVFPERIQKYFMLVHHDMVRNDEPKKGGDWFCRILYYPKNPKGQRYQLPLDGEVMKIMHRHAVQQIIFNERGITASQWTDGLLISATNPLPITRTISIAVPKGTIANDEVRVMTINGQRVELPKGGDTVRVTCLSAEDMDTPKFTTHEIVGTIKTGESNQTITVSVPRYSFAYFTIEAAK